MALVFVAAVIAAVPASAQDKKVDVNIGGGYTFAISEIRKHLGDGYNVNFGLTFHVTPLIGIQAEYSFNGMGKKQVNLDVSNTPGGATTSQPFYGDMNMQYGDFNLVIKPPTEGKIKPYIVAGAGVYYRPVKVTTPSVGYIPGYCDPWWYWCYPGGFVPIDKIVGSRSTTGLGIDVGAGFTAWVHESVGIYIEARYHYIWGPDIKDSTGMSHGKANGQFLPITVGLRF
jgi:opacity protein-like surface antigen